MEIARQFGINPILLVAQIVNFLVVFWVLKRFLYKPLLDVLKKRDKTIKEGLKQAEEARLLLERTAEKEKEVLRNAQVEGQKLLADTKKQRDVILQEAADLARKQAEQILGEARKQIAFETKEAQKQLSLQISGLAVEFLQKSVGELFSKEDQELIVKNALKKMKKRVD